MSIFSKIIAGEIPSYKIAEDEKFYAFLDIFPMVEGHTLVVPKTETDNMFDLSDDYLQAFDCNRCGMAVIGLEVPHAHLHLVPINSADDLNFTRGKIKLSEEQLKQAQRKIVDELNS
jgi:histidine triad (HIT) family protein